MLVIGRSRVMDQAEPRVRVRCEEYNTHTVSWGSPIALPEKLSVSSSVSWVSLSGRQRPQLSVPPLHVPFENSDPDDRACWSHKARGRGDWPATAVTAVATLPLLSLLLFSLFLPGESTGASAEEVVAFTPLRPIPPSALSLCGPALDDAQDDRPQCLCLPAAAVTQCLASWAG